MKTGGRVAAMKVRRERWRKLIAAAEASGMPIRQYCRSAGIPEHHYYFWRRRLAQEAAREPQTNSGSFVLVGTATASGGESAPLELVVERGWRLRISPGVDEGVLGTVLASLKALA